MRFAKDRCAAGKLDHVWGSLGQELQCCGVSVQQSKHARPVLVLAPLAALQENSLETADVAQLTAPLQAAESLSRRLLVFPA